MIPGRTCELSDVGFLKTYADLSERETSALHTAVYTSMQRSWLGHQMQKNPFDLMSQHDILYQNRPDILVETGTWHGGSALYYATLMDAVDHGIVITVDNWRWIGRPTHPRIHFVNGDSVDPHVVEAIRTVAKQALKVMVVLDSDHTKAHVLKELELYAPMVTMGQYLIVEDTNIHGNPIRSDLPEGPYEAVVEWLKEMTDFAIDAEIEPIISNCPGGYLCRVKPTDPEAL
jgi:cephalosporin hydroxylase